MRRPRLLTAAARARGTSLVEVLVTMVLVALTMLGLLAIQLRSFVYQADSWERRDAAVIATTFVDRVMANFAGFEAGEYAGLNFDPGDTLGAQPACDLGTGCTPAQIAERDWFLLTSDVSRRLPDGGVFVDTPAASGAQPALQITVAWRDPQRADSRQGIDTTVAVDPACNGLVTDVQLRCLTISTYP